MMNIDTEWTLFLDRDGVINRRIIDGYVCKTEDFVFLSGVLEAMPVLSRLFGRICVVSNQQGVGKKLMSEDALHAIHEEMVKKIELAGGRIDAVYCCTKLEAEPDNCRKPLPFMAFQAKNDFPEIQFSKTIMVGDSPVDMEFGKNIGAFTVFIGNPADTLLADFSFDRLKTFADSLNPRV
jgi:histidinol-phosphate phosphatase family protein